MAAESPRESALPLDGNTTACSLCESAGDVATIDGTDPDSDRPCYCRLAGMIAMLGKTHALPIIGLLEARGPLRYGEVEDQLSVTSSSTLTTRLEELAASDLIERRSYDEVPPRVEYSLTPLGHALTERLEPLLSWAAASAE